MERADAATYLGVSLSTLDRMATQGRLTRGRARRKTKPVTVFDKGELESLKKELEESKPKEVFRRLNTSETQGAIGFRLDPFYIARLREEGAKKGLSAGEYARKLVVQAIEDDRELAFTQELSALRENMARMFYLVLVTKLGATEEEANDLVSSLWGES